MTPYDTPPLDAAVDRHMTPPVHWLRTFNCGGRIKAYLACGEDDMASPWDDDESGVDCRECLHEIELVRYHDKAYGAPDEEVEPSDGCKY